MTSTGGIGFAGGYQLGSTEAWGSHLSPAQRKDNHRTGDMALRVWLAESFISTCMTKHAWLLLREEWLQGKEKGYQSKREASVVAMMPATGLANDLLRNQVNRPKQNSFLHGT